MNYLFHYPRFFDVNSFIAFLLSILFAISALFFYKKNESVSKLMLFGMGVSIAYFACSLDLFLHQWDEQFHALVAKNMMNDLLNPVLFKNTALSTSEHWTASHIWLHKQPLFLWQMTLSLKAFGVNEIALRLPNIIAHGLMTVMLFDIGKIVKNELLGILSAMLFCFLRFPLSYSAGMEATDHNDYMFMFYVSASFWALFKHHQSHKIKYLILLGIFCGCAVLVKWLTGFIAIGVWGSYCLIFDRKKLSGPFIAFFIAVISCLPWQIYCYLKYPSTYLLEIGLNAKHFSESVDGHIGNWYYHFSALKDLYANSNLVYVIIGSGILFFAFNKNILHFHKFVILASIGLVYIFFSFAKTRMPAFCMIVIPFVIITVTNTLIDIIGLIKKESHRRITYFIVVPQLIILFFSPSYFLKKHTLSYQPNEQDLKKYLEEKNRILELSSSLKDKKVVFMNMKGLAVKLMFYTDHEATNEIPDQRTIDLLKSQNYTLVVFGTNLPDQIAKDNSIIKL